MKTYFFFFLCDVLLITAYLVFRKSGGFFQNENHHDNDHDDDHDHHHQYPTNSFPQVPIVPLLYRVEDNLLYLRQEN